jgi:hypothetical protein
MSCASQDSSQCTTPDTGRDQRQRDGEAVPRLVVLQRQHDQRRQHADADEGDDAQHAEQEGRAELAFPRQDDLHQRGDDLVPGQALGLDDAFGQRLDRAARRVGDALGAAAAHLEAVGVGAGRRFARLLGHQLGIDAALRHQVGMAALLGDLAAVQHQDAVAVDHARQAMGEDQGGAALHQPVERLLDHRLVLGIDGAQRLVEHQDRRVAQQRAGDRQPLALAAGELDALSRRSPSHSPAAGSG